MVDSLGPGRRHADDVGQRAQQNSAAGIGLQHRMHRLLEVAMLERHLHRPVGLGFAGPAEQLDHVVVAELGEVQVLDLVGLVDLVELECLAPPPGRSSCSGSGSCTLAVSCTVKVASRGGTRNSCVDSRSSNSLKSGTSVLCRDAVVIGRGDPQLDFFQEPHRDRLDR